MSFSILAIMISCLGLFALASFTLKRKVKEIAIRKVMGSSVINIIRLFSWGFLKLVIIANLIAWPIAWFIMGEWVNDFAYKTEISWWLFFIAGSVAVLISFMTVAYQSLKAAIANPVDSLRDE
jgi:putative ABC transport system permease protein